MPRRNNKRGNKSKPKRSNRKGNNGPRAAKPKTNGGWSVPGGRSRVPRNVLPIPSGAYMLCCTNSNPFDPKCEGCKFPDGTNDHSIAITHRVLGSITASSYGNALVYYCGAAPYAILNTVPASATTYNIAPNFSTVTPPSLFTTNADKYRIVCWGVQVRVVSTVPDSGGELVFTRTSTTAALNTLAYPSPGLKGNDAETVPCVTGATYTYISKRQGPALWYTQNTNNNLWPNNPQFPWDCLQLEMVGGKASATTLSIQLVYHYEFTASADSGLYLIAPPDPPASPAVATVVANVQQSLPSVMAGTNEQLTEKIQKLVKQRLSKAAANAAGFARDAALEGLASLFP